MSDFEYENEAQKRADWNRKIAKLRREKEVAMQKRQLMIKAGIAFAIIALLAIIITVVIVVTRSIGGKSDKTAEVVEIEVETIIEPESEVEVKVARPIVDYEYTEADSMDYLVSDNMQSANAILVNIDTNKIVGQVDYKARIVPASMTKVMTILVAAEHITDVNEKVTMTIEATDFAYRNDCSSVGFLDGEVVTVDDLFYGTILQSGGDAAAQLAMYVAGSQEAFVDMMNEKCEELGIADTTHFTNTVGLYGDDHYSTCYDMAIIMNAAIDNEYCKKVMSEKKYTTSSTPEHPDGIQVSNWFLRRIEDKDAGGNVMCAKTGYVVQSGNCAVSYCEATSGGRYICVTASAHSAWRCIYDHVDIYKNHAN